jgi:hypothetical protein
VEEAVEDLAQILQEDSLGDCKVLVLANKQDIPGALSAKELSARLASCRLLAAPSKERRGGSWSAIGTSAVSGCGFQALLEKLAASSTAADLAFDIPLSGLLTESAGRSCASGASSRHGYHSSGCQRDAAGSMRKGSGKFEMGLRAAQHVFRSSVAVGGKGLRAERLR